MEETCVAVAVVQSEPFFRQLECAGALKQNCCLVLVSQIESHS